jgi:hypothetical protein
VKKSSCDETCEEVVVPCKPIIAELNPIGATLSTIPVASRHNFALWLSPIAASRSSEMRSSCRRTKPVHTRVEVSDLRVVRGYVGDQQCSTRPTHLPETPGQGYEEVILQVVVNACSVD